MGKVRSLVAVAALLIAGGLGYVAGGGSPPVARGAAAAADCQPFAQTGKQVCGRFLEYWTQNGGLAQQGFPLSGELDERSAVDGKIYRVQYFERAVFEYHPENPRPHDVLLGLVGGEAYARRYPAGQSPSGTPFAVGQTLVLTGSSSHGVFNVTIADMRRQRQLGSATAKGVFLVVTLRETNLDTVPAGARYFAIRDQQGRLYRNSPEGGVAGFQTLPSIPHGTPIPPGETRDAFIVFDVEIDATSFTIEL